MKNIKQRVIISKEFGDIGVKANSMKNSVQDDLLHLEGEIRKRYEAITKTLIGRKLLITAMESCTSGFVASLLTDTEGASAVFKGSDVTYSNEAKIMRGVPASVIDEYGVYSLQTAVAMATACRNSYKSNIGIGVTGTFGNVDPENADSVAGKVYFAIDFNGEVKGFAITLEPCDSRFGYKLAVAKAVAEELAALII